MAEQWIEASKALSIAGNKFALCDRVHAGLIGSRARLFVTNGRGAENVLIPTEFWWADGLETIRQNWTLGDFSTWMDKNTELKAFGVKFSLSGVIDMLPPERRAAEARNLSVVGNPDWVSAKEVRRIAWANGNLDLVNAERFIVQQARLGFLPARAVLAKGSSNRQLTQSASSGHLAETEWDAREWDISPAFWEDVTSDQSNSPDWELGIFTGLGGCASSGVGRIMLTGVYFLKESLAVLAPAQIAQPAKLSKNAGGRPPAPYWDQMWCAVWGRIYRGELVPKRQSDVENAMLQWLTDGGHDSSTSTVRPRARQLFVELQKEGENSSKG